MAKQKLSSKARAAKAARDLQTAKTPRRRTMKAENQRKRRAAKKRGTNVSGKDYDHNRGKFVSVKTNRSATKTTNNTMPVGKWKKPAKKKKKVGLSSRASSRATTKLIKSLNKNKKKK